MTISLSPRTCLLYRVIITVGPFNPPRDSSLQEEHQNIDPTNGPYQDKSLAGVGWVQWGTEINRESALLLYIHISLSCISRTFSPSAATIQMLPLFRHKSTVIRTLHSPPQYSPPVRHQPNHNTTR